MKKVGFKMQLNEGMAEEYQRRHDEIWPELTALLHNTGISDYAIFLDEATHILFGVLSIADPVALEDLPQDPVMRRWWSYMADIMATNPDDSPVSIPLKQVFYLP